MINIYAALLNDNMRIVSFHRLVQDFDLPFFLRSTFPAGHVIAGEMDNLLISQPLKASRFLSLVTTNPPPK